MEKGSILDTSLEQYDRVLGLNLRAQYNITQKAAKYLIESKGNIVNVSSVNGIRSVGVGLISLMMIEFLVPRGFSLQH